MMKTKPRSISSDSCCNVVRPCRCVWVVVVLLLLFLNLETTRRHSRAAAAAATEQASISDGSINSNHDADADDYNEYLKSLDQVLFAPAPCPAHCPDNNNNDDAAHSSSSSSSSGGARIFYLILIHNARTQNDALHLFRAIRDPRNIVLIHYDRKFTTTNNNNNDSPLHYEVETCPCGATVRIESMYSVEWSRWSMNEPTLWGLQVAVDDYAGQWDTFVNLSGDTLPVYTTDTTAKLLDELSHYNFVTSRSCETGLVPTAVHDFPTFWHKRRHYTRDEQEPPIVFEYNDHSFDPGTKPKQALHPTKKKTKTITIHFGSQWVILQYDFCHWLVQQLRHSKSWPSQLAHYLQDGQFLMTDETFLPTVVMHAPPRFRDTIPPQKQSLLHFRNGTACPHLQHVRYERMDEHGPSSRGEFPVDSHYQVPVRVESWLPQPRVWGPYFLGVYDLGNIQQSGALYCRKISAYVDENIVRLLPVRDASAIPPIHWPTLTGVAWSPQPDWSVARAAWHKHILAKTGKRSGGADDNDDDDEEL